MSLYLKKSLGLLFLLALSLLACAPDQSPKAPVQPTTVAEVYPTMLQEQIARLRMMSAGMAKLKAQHDAALDAGQSFVCTSSTFSFDDDALEAEAVVASKTLSEYRKRHATEIRALLRASSVVRKLDATERQLRQQVAAQQATVKRICLGG